MSPTSLSKQSVFRNRPNLIAAIAMVVITAVGAWLRFHDLGLKSLWMDEYWQAFFLYAFRLDELLHITLSREWEPPLIYLLSFPMIKTFGFSEFALRLPSCLAGIATIPLAFLLGNRVAGRRVGLISALILCIHPTAFWYSQDARPYALFIFSTTLVLWLYCREIRRSRFSPAYAVGLIILAISHYFAIVPGMFLLAIDLYKQVFTNKKRKWIDILWEYLPYIVVTALLVYLRLSNFNLTPDLIEGPAPIAGINNWEMIYANLAFGYRRMHVLAWGLAIIGMVVMWFKRRELTVHYLLGGSIGVAALMFLCIYIFRFRYFYYLLPGMVLFISLALVWLLDGFLKLIKKEVMISRILGMVVISAGLVWWSYEPLVTRINSEKMDYRTLADLYGQVLDHNGILLIPIGDFGLTTYPPYSKGAINSILVANQPEELFPYRVARQIGNHPRGLIVFPTARQLDKAISIISAQGYQSFARLYVFGFHVLIWDEQLTTNKQMMEYVDKLFKQTKNVNSLMSKAYYFEDLGFYANALDWTNQALELNKDSGEMLATRARLLRNIGRDEDAIKDERRAWMIDVLVKNSTYVN